MDTEKQPSYIVGSSDFIGTYIKNIVIMAPGFKPRKLDIIIDKLKAYFREETRQFALDINNNPSPDNSIGAKYPHMTEDAISDLVGNAPKKIEEIEELNLSNYEFNNRITVDDPNRSMFGFVGRNFSLKEEHDFIDLDALTRNVFCELIDQVTRGY